MQQSHVSCKSLIVFNTWLRLCLENDGDADTVDGQTCAGVGHDRSAAGQTQ